MKRFVVFIVISCNIILFTNTSFYKVLATSAPPDGTYELVVSAGPTELNDLIRDGLRSVSFTYDNNGIVHYWSRFYYPGETITITCTFPSNLEFCGWSDGETSPIRTIIMPTHDVNLTALFTAPNDFNTYGINCIPSNAGHYTLNALCNEKPVGILRAYSNDEDRYIFKYWLINDLIESNEEKIYVNPYVDSYTAYFDTIPRGKKRLVFSSGSYGVVEVENEPGHWVDTGYFTTCSSATIRANIPARGRFICWDGEGIRDKFAPTTTVNMCTNRRINLHTVPKGPDNFYAHVFVEPAEVGEGEGGAFQACPEEEHYCGKSIPITAHTYSNYPEYGFWKWTGDPVVEGVTSSETHIKVVRHDMFLTAHFRTCKVETNSMSGGGIVISPTAPKIDVNGNEWYPYGDTITVRAIPNQGYVLKCWDDDTSIVDTCRKVYITSDTILRARFKPIPTTPCTLRIRNTNYSSLSPVVYSGGENIYSSNQEGNTYVYICRPYSTVGIRLEPRSSAHLQPSDGSSWTMGEIRYFMMRTDIDTFCAFEERDICLTTGVYAGKGSVTVSANGYRGTTYNGPCYPYDAYITVTAQPDAGYQFKQWHLEWNSNGIERDSLYGCEYYIGGGQTGVKEGKYCASTQLQLHSDATLRAEFESNDGTGDGGDDGSDDGSDDDDDDADRDCTEFGDTIIRTHISPVGAGKIYVNYGAGWVGTKRADGCVHFQQEEGSAIMGGLGVEENTGWKFVRWIQGTPAEGDNNVIAQEDITKKGPIDYTIYGSGDVTALFRPTDSVRINFLIRYDPSIPIEERDVQVGISRSSYPPADGFSEIFPEYNYYDYSSDDTKGYNKCYQWEVQKSGYTETILLTGSGKLNESSKLFANFSYDYNDNTSFPLGCPGFPALTDTNYYFDVGYGCLDSFYKVSATTAYNDFRSPNTNVGIIRIQSMNGDINHKMGSFLRGGTRIRLIATPKPGYHFGEWEFEWYGQLYYSNPIDTIVTKEMTQITAIFYSGDAPPTYTLQLFTSPSTISSPSGAGTYPAGTVVQISADTTMDCYQFTGWSDGDTHPTRSITINSDMTLTAQYTYTSNSYTTSLIVRPTNGGTISYRDYYASNLLTTCSTATVVTTCDERIVLQCAPATGYKFIGWYKNDELYKTSMGEFSIAPTTNDTYTARFERFLQQDYTLTLLADPIDGGILTGAGTYSSDTMVTFSATPNEGYDFIQWSDSVTVAERSITLTEDVTLTAQFARIQCVLNLSAQPSEAGTTIGSGTYDYGTKVTLVAQQIPGWRFYKWSDGSGANRRRLVLTERQTMIEAIYIRETELRSGWWTAGLKFIYPQTNTISVSPQNDTVRIDLHRLDK